MGLSSFRGTLHYVRFVKALDPDFLVMENVPQVLFHPLFRGLVNELQLNYRICYAVLNAALYGVPQTRHRAFVLALHRRLGAAPLAPAPTHGFVGSEVYNYCAKRLEKPENDSAAFEIFGADPVVASLPQLIG